MQSYSSLFVLVLQIRRAKSTLERILVRNALPGTTRKVDAEMKMFYAMRGKLSWFIKWVIRLTLVIFVLTYSS